MKKQLENLSHAFAYFGRNLIKRIEQNFSIDDAEKLKKIIDDEIAKLISKVQKIIAEAVENVMLEMQKFDFLTKQQLQKKNN